MKIIRWASLALVLVALLATLPVAAAPDPYDGLKVLGVGHHFQDDNGATLDLAGFETKYGERVVGLYFAQGGNTVHFYMNAAVWDKMKQKLIRARDQWDTLSATEYEQAGAIKGYQIANQKSTLRLGLQGATAISPRQFLLIGSGGASTPVRIVISLQNQELADLVNDFYKIDTALRTGGGK